MAQIKEKLRLYEDTFNADGMTDENSLANALLTEPDVLSPVITHLAGREDKRFPLSFLTEGVGNIHYIQDVEYDYPVMGRINKAVVAVSATGDGSNYQPFTIVFKDKWFIKDYLIEGPGNKQARIIGQPEQVPGGWRYTLQSASSDPGAVINPSTVAGGRWAQMFAPVATSGSRGNASNWVGPSKAKNQISTIRKSYSYEGNTQNRTVNIEFNVNGKKTKLWSDFEEWQHMLKWKEECENALWYSRYNRDKNGTIHLKDDNGKVIPLGSGVLEQIPNYDTYTKLTAQKLKKTVRDVLFGATDAQKMKIVLYTGTGGQEEFDNAMKEEVASGAYVKEAPSDAFVRGSKDSLEFGGFFTRYRHNDGHVIEVRHLPLFDHGTRADRSERHPDTNLPLESYRMVFLDQSVYDGEPNIKMVTRKGREMIRWAVAGSTIPKGFSGNATRASDIDGGSVQFLKDLGISIRRASNCMHLEMV